MRMRTSGTTCRCRRASTPNSGEVEGSLLVAGSDGRFALGVQGADSLSRDRMRYPLTKEREIGPPREPRFTTPMGLAADRVDRGGGGGRAAGGGAAPDV